MSNCRSLWPSWKTGTLIDAKIRASDKDLPVLQETDSDNDDFNRRRRQDPT